MKTETQQQTISEEKPLFRILIVEDEPDFFEGLKDYYRQYASEFYKLEIDTATTVDKGREFLQKALDSQCPYDAVTLDYRLPKDSSSKPTMDTSLSRFCIFNVDCARWVGQLTSWADDEEIKKFWPKPGEHVQFKGGIYEKEAANLRKIAENVFFREIKEPLNSSWLPRKLGAVESPVERDSSLGMPADFNLFSFIQRMGDAWPLLDEKTKQTAHQLFEIENGAHPDSTPNKIGIKSFSQTFY
ncbi:MAG: response regulator [Verrucomicrobia bacterium]|nr:response regulator [Verrucomicrobiota bacterium]